MEPAHFKCTGSWSSGSQILAGDSQIWRGSWPHSDQPLCFWHGKRPVACPCCGFLIVGIGDTATGNLFYQGLGLSLSSTLYSYPLFMYVSSNFFSFNQWSYYSHSVHLSPPDKHILTAFFHPYMFPPEQLHLLAFKASTVVRRSDAGEGLGDFSHCGMTTWAKWMENDWENDGFTDRTSLHGRYVPMHGLGHPHTRPNVTCSRSRPCNPQVWVGFMDQITWRSLGKPSECDELQHFCKAFHDYIPFGGWVCPNLLVLSLQHLKANEGKGIKLGRVMETNETDKVVENFCMYLLGAYLRHMIKSMVTMGRETHDFEEVDISQEEPSKHDTSW